MKTFLVTGATGLIGYNLTKRLIEDGNRVIALSRSEEKLNKCFFPLLKTNRLFFLPQDVDQKIKINEPLDGIFHAAGPMERDIVLNEPTKVIFPNIFGLINCINVMQNQKENGQMCRLVVFSSVSIYGDQTLVSEEDTNICDCLSNPMSAYSESKRMAEVISNAYQTEYGLDIVIARLSTVYGDTFFKPRTAFYSFISSALSNQDILLNSDKYKKRDNIFIDDAINGLIVLFENGVSGNSYNVSSNGDKNNYQSVYGAAKTIVEESHKSFGLNPKLSFVSNKVPKQIKGLKLNNKKLKNLGWHLKTSFSEGISKTLYLSMDKHV